MSSPSEHETRVAFATRTRRLIAKMGLTLPDFCARYGYSLSTVESWVYRGLMPRAQKLPKLASIFGVTTDYLLGLTEQ